MKFSFLSFETKPRNALADVMRTGASMPSPYGRATPDQAEILRFVQDVNHKMARSYDAARTNNFNQDFSSTFGSANAEILTSLYASRGRARTLVKDFSQGKAIQRTFQNNVVGHKGFKLKMRAGQRSTDATGKTRFKLDTELNRQIMTEYETAGRPENFSVRRNMSRTEAWRICEASAVRDGSILLRHHRGFPNNKYGYAIDLVESDRLQESYMGRSPRGNNIRFSIEVDEYNAPIYYWILDRHPGDVFERNNIRGAAGIRYGGQVFREEVPAENIIHYNNLRDRAEQDIGMTELDCIIQDLHRSRQYNIALAYAAIASCCKPFWIKKAFPTGLTYTADEMTAWMTQVNGITGNQVGTGSDASADGVAGQQRVGPQTNVLSPANTEKMNWGEELMQLDPKFPVEAASEYQKDCMRGGAVGVGIAYQSISGDFQNLGFSASRQSELPQRDTFKVRQEHFIDVIVRPHFREWLKYAILSGNIDCPISRLDELVDAAQFQGRRWAYVNPLQDSQCDIMDVQGGFRSPQQIQDEREDGKDLEELYDEIAEAKEAAEERGLEFGEAAQTADHTGDPGQDDTEAPEAKPEPKKGGKQTIRKTRTLAHRNGNGHLTTKDLLLMQGDGR